MSDIKTKNRLWINPCDCGCGCEDDDEDMYSLSYEIPGVEKNEIDLKITEDGLRLIAPRGDIEYYSEFAFSCKADSGKAQALYENGLLTIEVPLNCPAPFKDAKSVKIS